MKITRLRTYQVPPRWLFLRIDTDEGIVGWGEPVVEGRAETVRTAVDELSDYLVGTDPGRVEDHWQVLTKGGFYRGGPVLSSAVAGIDQALWDIKGKALGVPVHELLGGPVRDRMRVYSWIAGDEPSAAVEHAAQRVREGFSAVKMNVAGRMRPLETTAEIDAAVERARAVKDELGPHGDVAVDFHGRVAPPLARRLCRELEQVGPLFVEEPVLPELSEELPRIVGSTTVPIATGERLYSRWDFADVLRSGIAVAQPDLSHAGGISECRRIAAQAEIHGVGLAPHCPLGPIALAASLQVDFASPNALIQETGLGIHYNQGSDVLDYLADTSVFDYSAGYVSRPTGPGLGIEIDEEVVAEAEQRAPRWRNPVWRHDDGSFAEW
ncbi:galactonate dehydratase [Bounagaea algeriensis]